MTVNNNISWWILIQCYFTWTHVLYIWKLSIYSYICAHISMHGYMVNTFVIKTEICIATIIQSTDYSLKYCLTIFKCLNFKISLKLMSKKTNEQDYCIDNYGAYEHKRESKPHAWGGRAHSVKHMHFIRKDSKTVNLYGYKSLKK